MPNAGNAMIRAAHEIPKGWEIRVGIEHKNCWVTLINPDGEPVDTEIGEYLRDDILYALEAAKIHEATKGMAATRET